MGIDRDQNRLTGLALRVMEDALAQACRGPAERSWGLAMALAWMLDIGCLQRWQCETFWRTVGDPCGGEPTEKYSNYFRTTTLTGLLDRCYLELGLDIPSQVQRRKWANRYPKAA